VEYPQIRKHNYKHLQTTLPLPTQVKTFQQIHRLPVPAQVTVPVMNLQQVPVLTVALLIQTVIQDLPVKSLNQVQNQAVPVHPHRQDRLKELTIQLISIRTTF
jgi:hypothetical protein